MLLLWRETQDLTRDSYCWPQELGTGLRHPDRSVCAHKTHTDTQTTGSRISDCVLKHHRNSENNNMSAAQWRFFFFICLFFERGGHRPVDSQTFFQLNQTVFLSDRQKTTLLFTVRQRNTGKKKKLAQAETQPRASSNSFEMFGIFPMC